jgi:hypothetical protein
MPTGPSLATELRPAGRELARRRLGRRPLAAGATAPASGQGATLAGTPATEKDDIFPMKSFYHLDSNNSIFFYYDEHDNFMIAERRSHRLPAKAGDSAAPPCRAV